MDTSTNNTPQAGTRIYQKDKEEPSEIDERFRDFKAGAISDNLREALGISRDDLAPYIYQMRWFGYPPGHLEAAKVQKSGLSFYHNSSMAPEPGEDVSEDTTPSIVNVDELIKFPGFNVNVDDNVIDDHVNLGAPPMDPSHSHDVMVSYYKHQNNILLERQKSTTPATANTPRNTVVTNLTNEIVEVDMEVVEEVDEIEVDQAASPALETPTSNGVTSDNHEAAENGANYDSMEMTEDELEKRRQMILKQLAEEEEDEVIFIPPPPLPTIDLTSDTPPVEDAAQQQDNALSSSFLSNNGSSCVKTNGIESSVSPIKKESGQTNQSVIDTTADNTETNNVDSSVVSGYDNDADRSSRIDLDESDSAVPHRSNFAKGITQFDQFYDETKSKGTYNKLRNLLKQSPHSRVSKET